MRKRTMASEDSARSCADGGWLDLDAVSSVEITSEDPLHPIESALVPGAQTEWRAAAPGRQVIRLRFDEPRSLSRIGIEFNERGAERTQEYVLRWSDDDGESFREIVRQQWNFSAPDATREAEEHHVEVRGVTDLELIITPDIRGGNARASLTRLRLT